MSNVNKIEKLLLEDILKINGNDYELVLKSMIEQINDKGTLNLILTQLVENELIKFSYKLASYLDKNN